MSEKKEGSGSCICGAVTFLAKTMSQSVGACHCNTCRKWGGGPFMEVDCGPEVKFDGADKISIFNSSEWAERGFCSQCGSHLFYRLKESGEHMVPVGLFTSDAGLVFDQQVFIDEKPSYYSFANETTKMTGAELFAKYAPPPK